MSRHKRHASQYTPIPDKLALSSLSRTTEGQEEPAPLEMVTPDLQINEETILTIDPPIDVPKAIEPIYAAYRILEDRKIGWAGGHTTIRAGKVIRDKELIQACKDQKVPMEGVV